VAKIAHPSVSGRFAWAMLTCWLVSLAAACSSGKAAAVNRSPACTPYETRECWGPGACKGGQMCLPDGTGWAACDCGQAVAPAAPPAGPVTEIVAIDHSPQLRGTDADGNGVRDDIDHLIQNYDLPTTDRTKLQGYARALQAAIELDQTATDQDVLAVANRIDRALQCALSTLPTSAPQQIREIEALSINTRERVGAYFTNFERRIDGVSFQDVPDPCT
jgi:hypothetical protein